MARATRVHSTPPLNLTTALKLIDAAGMSLESDGTRFRIMRGRQLIVGRGRRCFELTRAEVVDFVRGALVR